MKILLCFLFLVCTTILFVLLDTRNSNLKVVACDVGQGDAILITQGSHQVLVDAGPGKKVIECLDRYMFFWDRKIEMIVLTHPQLDHFGGLLEIFEKYNVEYLLESGQNASSREYQLLQSIVGSSDTIILEAADTRSTSIGLMHLEVLHPSKNFILVNSKKAVGKKSDGINFLGKYESTRDPNEFSVTAVLTYGSFDALLTGDISPNISDQLAQSPFLQSNNIEYLKVPHHGSKNGLTKKLLRVVRPNLAVISSGEKNRFGHPHKEILNMLKEEGVEVFRTDQIGDFVVESDGQKFWVN